MEETLYFHALKLRKALDCNKDVLLLLELEQNLNKNVILSQKLADYQRLQNELNDLLLTHDVDSQEAKVLRKQLAELKYNLDLEPEIARYNNQFRLVSAIYKHISHELFADFKDNKGPKCH